MRLLFLFFGLMLISLSACVPVKPWERAYLNDEDMSLSNRPIEKGESNVHAYREGCSGAGGSKTGGGCGCN